MKKIIHIDADCFYAAIEMRENPTLKTLPIAVGGSAEKRGVIATCNYEARKFGVHSAMSSALAMKHCPHLQIIPPRMSVYREYSVKMREIFSEYSDHIEPLSLDEAYLDVSDSEMFRGSATLIAQDIRRRIFESLEISVSAGVAPAKFLAKVASDWEKPNGLTTISPRQVEEFVELLPVNKLPGVGPVTTAKLARFGLHTCRDIKNCGLTDLIRLLGGYGQQLYNMACGIDERVVRARRDRKSVSVERTFENDLQTMGCLFPKIPLLMEELTKRFKSLKTKHRIKGVFVKLKFDDFTTTTVETVLSGELCRDTFARLLTVAWYRKKRPVRLIGLGYRLSEDTLTQLCLDFEDFGDGTD